VRVEILDVSGALVATPWEGRLAGEPISLQWDGRDRKGRSVPSGVYFVRARWGEDVEVQKVTLMR
jgi:flagellar hook assembly protein FlgD